MSAPRLLLVDGHGYAYRAFHAIRALHGPDGSPTNAIYGFVKMVGRLNSLLAPGYQAVVWDGGLAAERQAALPEYKQQRPPMPAALEQQLPGIMAWLEAMRCASLLQPGVEADDWIAGLAARGAAAGLEVVIASSDKDFMQLVGGQVGLLNPNDRTEKIWTADVVRNRTGVRPDQIVDWLSLVGDASDNIPGVPGIGPKTAAQLLARFGSVDALYARLDEVDSDKLRRSLQQSEPEVRRNQNLIRLKPEACPEVGLESLRVQPPDTHRLRALYEQWGFKSLLAELAQPATAQGSLW
jgi:DNA polymerase-1